ncbi:MAG TPA: HAMP domain-containing sensor histidine kinase [Chloroflexota bacterium]|nr:HAMP domain-containing sensor histidine kinase [Chloroflexota bacterium]
MSLAARSPVRATTDVATVAFATLVGPVGSTTHPAPGRDTHLLATVAHELRNPLASLRMSLDLLVNDFDDLEPEAALRLLHRAQRSARWLQGLTENLTSSACVEAGRLDVRTAPVELPECIEEAILLVRGLLDERGQHVRVTCSAPATLAVADRARVIQILANLLTNASRYSVTGDEIELHLSMVGHQLRLRVTDHGPGISPEDQQRIFGAWVRGEGSGGGGLGLGLSIVQSLIERQGGRVGVESTLGHGATFWFTLPAAVDPGARTAPTCRR